MPLPHAELANTLHTSRSSPAAYPNLSCVNP
eukprot:CAMPEP_0206136066 /NCGR_PEP_ID=MMETSP1473-20131121/1302_1 /ASSEMBLY_ACC=CAM_ASM_001109 /TAXON_ID=1461547 /ORGANISM="Stichococcus sp, Strain RCC1054" /LENGTH=30 /DNA_ID= /DNA_START= /DNA_END= /DNA_ORIENTATION=